VYQKIAANRSLFLGAVDALEKMSEDVSDVRGELESFFENISPQDRSSVRELIEFLFPQIRPPDGKTRYNSSMLDLWRKSRRIASHDFFDRYFLFTTSPEDVSESEIRDAFVMSDVATIKLLLSTYEADGRLGRFFERGLYHGESMQVSAAESWTFALCDQQFMNRDGVELLDRVLRDYGRTNSAHQLLLRMVGTSNQWEF
jgi:hypothetical protein